MELNGGLYELALLLVDDALIFRCLNNGGEFLFLLFRILLYLTLHRQSDQIHQPHHDENERPQNNHQETYRICVLLGINIRAFFGCDLRNRFTEYDDGNRDQDSGDPCILICTRYEDDRYRPQRRAGDVDQIIADQDRPERIIKVLGYIESYAGFL